MISKRQLFLDLVGQTNEMPLALQVSKAEGIFIYDEAGKMYYDMNSGISVSSLGHRHPQVIEAIKSQLDKHLHTMVYGEHIQSPQIEFAQLLTSQLGQRLNCVYYAMTGSEATEIAMKLSKKYTGRAEIIACKNAYHGSTQGAESLRSDESYKRAFYPLLPMIHHIHFNNLDDVDKISAETASVIIEIVQGEAGVILPNKEFLEKIQKKCKQTKTLLIIDEIQSGFGRTGSLFAFQKYGITPDVLLIGKAMGGGMPIAAVVSNKELLSTFTKNPALGHISTFAGHPVCCAAAAASLKVLLQSKLIVSIAEKEKLFHQLLDHEIIKEIRSSGLMMAVEMTKRKYLKHVVAQAFEQGLIIDYFLFNNKSFRLAPPLIINEEQIKKVCQILLSAMDYAKKLYEKKRT